MFGKKKEVFMNTVEKVLDENFDLTKTIRLDSDEENYVRTKKVEKWIENPYELFFRTDKYEMMLRLEYRQKIIEQLLEKLFNESKKVEELNKKVYDRIVTQLNMATTDIDPIKTELRNDYLPSKNRVITSRRIYVQGFEMIYFIDTEFKTENKKEKN